VRRFEARAGVQALYDWSAVEWADRVGMGAPERFELVHVGVPRLRLADARARIGDVPASIGMDL
jgi:hypothetical protein